MTTYLAEKPFPIRRRESNIADIELTVPDCLSMAGRHFRFQVWDKSDNILFEKSDTVGGSIVGQKIVIILGEDDMLGFDGIHSWECVISNPGPITVGFGPFTIIKSRNR